MARDRDKRRDELNTRLQNAALKGAWQREPKEKAKDTFKPFS